MGQLDYLKTFPSIVFNKIEKKENGDVTNEVVLAMDAEPTGSWLVCIPVEESLREGDVDEVDGINVITLLTRAKYTRELGELDKKFTNRCNEIVEDYTKKFSDLRNELSQFHAYVNRMLQQMYNDYTSRISNAIRECKNYTDARIREVAPVGSIICVVNTNGTTSSDISRKYMEMDGAYVSSSSYYELYNLIVGTCVPNMKQEGIFLGGGSSGFGSWVEQSLPNVKGEFARYCGYYGGIITTSSPLCNGPFAQLTNASVASTAVKGGDPDPYRMCDFSMQRYSNVYEDNALVKPRHYKVRYFIRHTR